MASINIPAELELVAIKNANIITTQVANAVQRGLDSVKFSSSSFNINVDTQLEAVGNLGKALSELKAAGGEALNVTRALGKVLEGVSNVNPYEILKKDVASYIEAVTAGNDKIAKDFQETFQIILQDANNPATANALTRELESAAKAGLNAFEKAKAEEVKIAQEADTAIINSAQKRALELKKTALDSFVGNNKGSVIGVEAERLRQTTHSQSVEEIITANQREALRRDITSRVSASPNFEVERLRQTTHSQSVEDVTRANLAGFDKKADSSRVSGLREDIIGRTKDLENARKEAEKFGKATISIEEFGKSAALAFKRYSAFLVGAFVIGAIVGGIKSAQDQAIQFEKEITKIQQVLDITAKGVLPIGENIRKSALETGTAATEIAQGVSIFAQAGFKDVKQLADVANQLAKIPLAATFDGVEPTVEGLIAIFGQFNKTLDDTGEILDTVNQFAADFAVESKDIFEGVRRGGSAFATAGGSLKDFIALFSLLRESTRESAETLGTFFKSGFGELVQPKSQQLLKQLGVTAVDVIGQLKQLSGILVGPNSAFSGLERIDIARQLTGGRQFNRLLSLLKELQDPSATARVNKAFAESSGSLDRSVAKRIDDIGVSFQKIKANFIDFALALAQNESVKTFAKDIADLTSSLSGLFRILQPVLPLLITLGAAKLLPKVQLGAQSAINFLKGRPAAALSENGFSNVGNISGPGLPQPVVFSRATGLPITPAVARRPPNFGRLGAIAGVGAVLGGTLLNDVSPNPNSSIHTADFGQALVNGGQTGLLVGAAFGPVAGAIVGLLVGIKELKNSLDKNTEAQFKREFAQSNTFGEQIGTIINGANPVLGRSGTLNFGQELSGGVNNALSGFGKNFKDNPITSALSIATLIGPLILGTERNKTGHELVSSIEDNDERGKALQKSLLDSTHTIIDNLLKESKGQNISGGTISDKVRKTLITQLQSEFDTNHYTGEKAVDVINEFLTKNAKEFTKDIDQAIQVFQFRDESVALRAAFTGFTNKTVDLFKNLSDQTDKLDSIIVNRNDFGKVNASNNPDTLLQANGQIGLLNGVNDFNKQTEKIANNLTGLFAEFQPRKILDSFLETRKAVGGKDDVNFSDRSSDFTVNEVFKRLAGVNEDKRKANPTDPDVIAADKQAKELFSRFGEDFSRIIEESGKGIVELLEEFGTAKGPLIDLIKTLRPGTDAIKLTEDALHKLYDQINKSNEIELRLAERTLQVEQSIFDLKEHLSDLSDTIEDKARNLDQFFSANTPVTNLRNNASVFNQRANDVPSSVDVTNAILRSGLASSNLNITTAGLAGANADGISVEKARSFSKERNSAFIEFLQSQQNVNKQLFLFGKAISAADAATESLKEAFTSANEGLKSAGQSISNFTRLDLSQSFTVLKRFLSAANLKPSDIGTNIGVQKAGKALDQLNSVDIEQLEKLLSSVGNIPLGNGVNLNAVLGDITKGLGITIGGFIKSAVTGQNPADASRDITRELDGIEADAKAAAKKAEDLRKKQAELLQSQVDQGQQELEFLSLQNDSLQIIAAEISRNDQLKVLQSMDKTLVGILNSVSPTASYNATKKIIDGFNTDPNNLPKGRGVNESGISIFGVDNNGNPGVPKIPEPRSIDASLNGVNLLQNTPVNASIIGQDDITNSLGQINDILSKLDNLTGVATSIDDSLTNLLSNGITAHLEVAPVMVNVNLLAPDFLKIVGPQLRADMLAAIDAKLTEVFQDDPEKLGKLKAG